MLGLDKIEGTIEAITIRANRYVEYRVYYVIDNEIKREWFTENQITSIQNGTMQQIGFKKVKNEN